jgi:hypothetical protein
MQCQRSRLHRSFVILAVTARKSAVIVKLLTKFDVGSVVNRLSVAAPAGLFHGCLLEMHWCTFPLSHGSSFGVVVGGAELGIHRDEQAPETKE